MNAPRFAPSVSAAIVLATVLVYTAPFASADSSSPRLAAYYNLFLAICGNQVYEWEDEGTPKKAVVGAVQVGVGKSLRFALTDQNVLLAWGDDAARTEPIMKTVKSFHAGRSGLFVIRHDDSLWHIGTKSYFGLSELTGEKPTMIVSDIVTAAIGDSANYYVTRQGMLFVKGRAHRGQYGDGKLRSTDTFVNTASNVTQISSHTGHALILKDNGEVLGSGGNIYGPLGHHGYGDKAIEWGVVFRDAKRIATGSSHSVAIRHDNSLWIWGGDEGLDPKRVLTEVDAVAAGSPATIALSRGGLWQWDTGDRPRRLMACE